MKKLIFAGLILFFSGCSFLKKEIIGVEEKEQQEVIIHVPEKTGNERIFFEDFLGAEQRNFNVEQAVKYIPKYTSFGYLDWTFSSKVSHFQHLLDVLRSDFVRVHLLNTTCVRNRNCGAYEPVAGYSISSLDKAIKNKNAAILRHVRERTLIYKAYGDAYFLTKFLISPALEHDLSAQAWRVLADTVKSVWPEVQLVNSALKNNGERYKGAWRECHGKNPPKDCEITSLDGEDISDISISTWIANTRGNRLTGKWSRSYNCRNQADNFTDPRKRNSCPKEYQFEELAHVTDDRGPAPKPTFKCNFIAFKAPRIWKPFAEDEGTGDKRANLPVAMVEGATSSVTVVAYNGKSLGKLGHYGTFQGNLRRYYSGAIGSGINGYRWEKLARAQSGYPHVWLKQGGKCWGPIVAGQRNGAAR